MPAVRIVSLMAGVILLAEIGWMRDRHQAWRMAQEELRQRREEWLQLAGRRPPPTGEVTNRLAADGDQARRAVARMEAALVGRGSDVRAAEAGKEPVSRTDAYFDLAAFGERMRELARSRGVTVGPDATHFGFSGYVNEAPAAGHLAAVLRQRVVTEVLVRHLLESGPRELLAVRREKPRDEKGRAEHLPAAGRTGGDHVGPSRGQPVNGPDFFEPEHRLSVCAPGTIETMAFRFTFTGRTAVLRSFLSRIGSGELPILVRGVEVEPVAGGEARDGVRGTAARRPGTSGIPSFVLRENNGAGPGISSDPGGRAAPELPVVARPWSRFTVTLEHIELIGAGVTSGRADAGRPDGT